MRPPPSAPERAEVNSSTKATGRRAMIPIMMMTETPLPMPLSVMRSPSHKTNIDPAARMMVDITMNPTPSPIKNAPLPCVCALRLMRYVGAWKVRIASVKKRVY